jgi:hypothetical protein
MVAIPASRVMELMMIWILKASDYIMMLVNIKKPPAFPPDGFFNPI